MNSVERAADWLFSHADDLDGAAAAVNGTGQAVASKVENDDGLGEYELFGFVSHIGKHTSHGHYVCHMRRGEGGSWVIFDDSKAAERSVWQGTSSGGPVGSPAAGSGSWPMLTCSRMES